MYKRLLEFIRVILTNKIQENLYICRNLKTLKFMLRKFLAVSIIILTFSCNKEKTTGFVINGTINASANGKKVTLIKADMKNQELLDSTTVTNGKLVLDGLVETPDIYVLSIEGVNGKMPIVVENTEMTISFDTDTLLNSQITGSKENDVLKEFLELSKPLQKKNMSLAGEFRAAQSEGDTVKMKELRETFNTLLEETNEKNIALIEKHNDKVTSAAFLDNLLTTKAIETKKAQEIYNSYTDDVKNSRLGKSINEKIEVAIVTAEGSIAPNFSATNPEGKTIALNDIKGKATIIDFWAAWCGPCRKENPNVVKVYNKYHDKGLEIISVSLDGTPRQKDAKAAWIEAIEKDNLTWHHVSNLQYFNGPIAKQYNIQAIPATFILDAEGKIVAKNLRGQELEDKIAEMLN